MTAQDDVNAAVAEDTALLADLTTQTAAISAAQTALAAYIASLPAGVDTSALDAVNAQLVTAQPVLDSAVTSLTSTVPPVA